MNDRQFYRGTHKVCPICGRNFFIGDPESWAFKMDVTVKRHRTLKYFCRYSCKRKFEKEHEERVAASREEGIRKKMAKKGDKK